MQQKTPVNEIEGYVFSDTEFIKCLVNGAVLLGMMSTQEAERISRAQAELMRNGAVLRVVFAPPAQPSPAQTQAPLPVAPPRETIPEPPADPKSVHRLLSDVMPEKEVPLLRVIRGWKREELQAATEWALAAVEDSELPPPAFVSGE